MNVQNGTKEEVNYFGPTCRWHFIIVEFVRTSDYAFWNKSLIPMKEVNQSDKEMVLWQKGCIQIVDFDLEDSIYFYLRVASNPSFYERVCMQA